MKRAIRIKNGSNVKIPMIAKRMANPLPMSAAIWVALCRGIRPASQARSTRPPSMGKAGIRLKKQRMVLRNPKYPATKITTPATGGFVMNAGVTTMMAKQTAPKMRLATGPTSAMGSSAFGSGMPSSMVAIPPKIISVMLWIAIPFLWATSEWASS